MAPEGTGKLLRIFTGELDRVHATPLHEAIVRAAQQAGLAGATVLRGLLSYGASNHLHSAKVLRLSEDLPIIVEIVDEEAKVRAFLEVLHGLIDQAGGGALVTLETVEVLRYQARKR